MLPKHFLDLTAQITFFIEDCKYIFQADYAFSKAKGFLIDLNFIDQTHLKEIIVINFQIILEWHTLIFISREIIKGFKER